MNYLLKNLVFKMMFFLFIFLMSFLSFSKNVFFLGFSLLLLSCFLVFYVWKFMSQWLGLIFFLVYMTGVMVMFMFFCSFSSNMGGLMYNPIFSLLFFVFLVSDSMNFFYKKDSKNLSQSAEFYFISEMAQIFLLGMWLMFVLWSSLKIINMLGGSMRLM